VYFFPHRLKTFDFDTFSLDEEYCFVLEEADAAEDVYVVICFSRAETVSLE